MQIFYGKTPQYQYVYRKDTGKIYLFNQSSTHTRHTMTKSVKNSARYILTEEYISEFRGANGRRRDQTVEKVNIMNKTLVKVWQCVSKYVFGSEERLTYQ
jgi:hypothetical protein